MVGALVGAIAAGHQPRLQVADSDWYTIYFDDVYHI